MRQLAVMFRTNDPNLGHCSTLDEMTDAGLAYVYGLFRGTPWNHKAKRRRIREEIAAELEKKADKLEILRLTNW